MSNESGTRAVAQNPIRSNGRLGNNFVGRKILPSQPDRLSKVALALVTAIERSWLADRNGDYDDHTRETSPGLYYSCTCMCNDRAWIVRELEQVWVSCLAVVKYAPCQGDGSWQKGVHRPLRAQLKVKTST